MQGKRKRKRESEKKDALTRLLVIASFSEKEQTFRAPDSFDLSKAKLILHTYPDEKTAPADRKKITLRPYEARVYQI